MAEHTHRWTLFSTTTEEAAAEAEEPRAVHAFLPVGHPEHADKDGNPQPHDPSNKDHVKALKAAGVEDFSQPGPRKAGDVYLCECGEARHTAPGQSPEEVDA